MSKSKRTKNEIDMCVRMTEPYTLLSPFVLNNDLFKHFSHPIAFGSFSSLSKFVIDAKISASKLN